MIGPELVINGEFHNNVDGWQAVSDATLDWNSGGYADLTGLDFSDYIFQDIPSLQQGEFYVVKFTITGETGSELKVQLGGSLPFYALKDDGQFGDKQIIIKADIDGYDTRFKFRLSGPFIGTLDKISVRHVDISDLELGDELITNGGFNGSATGWTLGTGWTYGSNKVATTGAGGGFSQTLAQNISAIEYFEQYLIEIDTGVPTDPLAYINIEFGDWISDYLIPGTSPIIDGRMVLQAINLGFSSGGFNDKTFFVFTLTNGTTRFNSTIDNISVKKILGLKGDLPDYNPSIITAVKTVEQNTPFPKFVIGGRGTGSLYGLFKKSSSYDFTIWRSPVYQIGKPFDVLEIKFPIFPKLTGDMEMIPKLYFDNQSVSKAGSPINSDSYINEERLIKLTSKNFGNEVSGKSNFFFELQFPGPELVVVGLPVTFLIEAKE